MRPYYVILTIVILGCCSVTFIGIMPNTWVSVAAEPTGHDTSSHDQSTNELARQEYERFVDRYDNWTFEQLKQHLHLNTDDASRLSFAPENADHYDVIRRALKLTAQEQAMFKTNGLVVVDPKQRHSFASVYYQIYSSDLPVLVTTDSVLHAWHHSYSNMLQEFENSILMPALASVLEDCHQQLAKQLPTASAGSLRASYEDVDLYLTVARNLLVGAGSEEWGGNLVVPSVSRVDDEAVERLFDIRSLKLQVQYPRTESTKVYGGERYVDYSQFRPRGHYTKSSLLQNYFRCMMWLGRADCGFYVLPVDPVAEIFVDWQRELRDAALLSQLVRDCGSTECLSNIAEIIQLLVGESDNLTVAGMLALLESEGVAGAEQLTDQVLLVRFADAIGRVGHERQRIRSQSVVSNPFDTYKVPPPALFQMFGQGFAIDSFVLSHSVFDSIIFDGRKQRRMMPTSLDVAAALGNDHAAAMLESELRKWNYSANLLASRDFVSQLGPDFWSANVYQGWLDILRTLHGQPANATPLPEVMQRKVWRDKQLQTQLASWSELRHDNVLYTKQSYTAVPGCQYPDGFVEPYPELFGKLAKLATTTATRLGRLKIPSDLSNRQQQRKRIQDRHIGFLHRFAEIMDQLKVIAQRELASQPMTSEQRRFIEKTIDRRGSLPNGSGSKPRYDGWYCDLLYDEDNPPRWNPTIVDVHTNPRAHETLQAGVGNVNFAVIAVDNQSDISAYVGPVYSYYEFTSVAENRLYDEQWQQLITQDKLPSRPKWTASFVAAAAKRSYDGLSVQDGGQGWVVMESTNGRLKKAFEARRTDVGLRELLSTLKSRGFSGHFGISLGAVTQEGLQTLIDVEQLSWINISGSKIPAHLIEDFHRLRPDVEIMPRPFGIATVVTCRKIDGLRRFEPDTSGELHPGQELLLYVEPANLTWARRSFRLRAKLEVTTTLTNASGVTIVSQVSDPLEMQNGQPGELVHSTVKMKIPDSIKPGDYILQVDLTDAMSNPSRKATASLKLVYQK